MSMSRAAARKLDNYPASTNPVGIAFWVVQKLDHAGRAMKEVDVAEKSRRSSEASTNLYLPDEDDTDDKSRRAVDKKARKRGQQAERKKRQRQDNWVKNKENDVVARLNSIYRQQHSKSKAKGKRKAHPRNVTNDDDDGDDSTLKAEIRETFDRIIALKKAQVEPKLSNMRAFHLNFEEGLHLYEDSGHTLSPEALEAAHIFASILPALGENESHSDFQSVADTIIAHVQDGNHRVDDLVKGMEALMAHHEVEVGVEAVMNELYPDRSRPSRANRPLPETVSTRKDRNLATKAISRHPSFDQSNTQLDDQSIQADEMASNAPLRTSGRVRKSTARLDEAISVLSKSKRNPRTSNSPSATSPSQTSNPKKLTLKISENDTESNHASPVQNGTLHSDPEAPRYSAKRRSKKVKKPVSNGLNDTDGVNKESSAELPKTNGTEHEISKKTGFQIPQILVSPDTQEMPRSHLHRPELVQNILDACASVMNESFSSDESDSEPNESRPPRRASKSKRRRPDRRSTRVSSKMNGVNSSTVSECDKSLVNFSTIVTPANSTASVDDGKAATEYYVKLAQEWRVQQASPQSAGLPYPEFQRPMTDRDGWTSTGVINEFGEEVVNVDSSRWEVHRPHQPAKSCGPHETRTRLKSKRQIAEDNVFGFPPPAKRAKLDHSPVKISKNEDVVYETDLYRARKAMEDRHQPYDRSMSLEELKSKVDAFDLEMRQSATVMESDAMSIDENERYQVEKDKPAIETSDQHRVNGHLTNDFSHETSINTHEDSPVLGIKPAADPGHLPMYPVGYSPVKDSATGSSEPMSVDSANIQRNDSLYSTKVAEHRASASPMSGQSAPVTAVHQTVPFSSTRSTPIQSFNALPPLAPPISSMLPPPVPSSSAPPVLSASAPPFPPGPHFHQQPMLPPLQGTPHFQPPGNYGTINHSHNFRPPPGFAAYPPQYSPQFLHGPSPLSHQHPNTSAPPPPPPLPPPGQNIVFLDPKDPRNLSQTHLRTTAINGGPPGGGHVINPPRKMEQPGYRKKAGPDFKMELVNGRLAKPGDKPQPKPKRGGQVIDFTGIGH
ncbi:MAG: hypothetical protein Q9227_004161 [Pyrenula ochraceoflavens]